MDTQIVVTLIALLVPLMGLWVRFEIRLTRLQGEIENILWRLEHMERENG